MKKSVFIFAYILFGLCACNVDEHLDINETPDTPAVYHMSIPAFFDAQTKGVTFDETTASTQFETTDKIYVYNETKGAFARDASNGYKLSYLQPTSEGSSCTLEGDLSFFALNASDEWEIVDIEGTDKYSLYYQMNDPNYSGGPNFDFTMQKGSAESASQFDFAQATNITMTLNGSTITVPESVRFTNLQSMFRQHLIFKKDDVVVNPAGFSMIIIDTNNGTLVDYYYPTEEDIVTYEDFIIANPVITDGDVFLALAFDYQDEDEKDDQLIMTVIDNENNIYQCTKPVPPGGFQNGKYYHGKMTMNWKYQRVLPTVTRSDGGDDDELKPSAKGIIYISDDCDPTEIKIEGDCVDYRFRLEAEGVVTLTGNGTATIFGDNRFILGDYGLNIILESDYTINSKERDGATIWADWNELKLSAKGGTHKLTVTTSDSRTYKEKGLHGDDNYYTTSTSETYNYNPNALAADGFAVSCSPAIDNGDGTYTWIYTVSPKPNYYELAPEDIGKVIGADGEIYANADAAITAGTTAEAMIAYVGSIPYVCSHGLAISLTDAYGFNTAWVGAQTVAIPEWATAHPVIGGTWRLPSKEEWQYMLSGSNSATYFDDITSFQTRLCDAGGTSLLDDSYYWTSTEDEYHSNKAFALYKNESGTSAGLNSTEKTQNWHVRACLSF